MRETTSRDEMRAAGVNVDAAPWSWSPFLGWDERSWAAIARDGSRKIEFYNTGMGGRREGSSAPADPADPVWVVSVWHNDGLAWVEGTFGAYPDKADALARLAELLPLEASRR